MSKPLQTDKPLDVNLKPVKDSDGTMSALEMSTDDIRVKGNVEAVGNVVGDTIFSKNEIYLGGSEGDAREHKIGTSTDNSSLAFYVLGELLVTLKNSLTERRFNFRDACATFTQDEMTFDATSTNCNFKYSNKLYLRLTGNITNLILNFPAGSGNFQIVLKQDGTGSRTITNYKAYDSGGAAASGSASVKWAGGSNPTLTTTADKVDIASFYWDATNEIAYGTISQNF